MIDHDEEPPVATGAVPTGIDRRDVFHFCATLVAGAAATACGTDSAPVQSQPAPAPAPTTMPAGAPGTATREIIVTKDNTTIFYKDWGAGQPVVFGHGWPQNADAWDEQLHFFATSGYRAIAYDRRGHGRSSQPWSGNDMDTYADDLAALLDKLDLRDAFLVGHSTGAGEIVRYLVRHGSKRVAKIALVGTVSPLLLQTAANPGGLPVRVFDDVRAGVTADRSQFYKDLALPFFSANRPGAKLSQGIRDQFWLWGMQIGMKAALDCVTAFSETDFTADLARIDVPTLVIHGDDDQLVPIDATARRTAELIKNATLKVYAGAGHGLMVTHRAQFHADLMAFLKK